MTTGELSFTRLTAGQIAENIGTLIHRNLLQFFRNRQLLILSLVQPLTNMVMFAYIFNKVASAPGLPYRQYVIPGVLVQAVMVSAMRTGVAVSYDRNAGMNDRFRSLPIARSAVILGRTISDSLKIAIQLTVLTVIAVAAVGFDFRQGLLRGVAAVAVLAVFGLAVTAFSAWVGLAASDPEATQMWLITPTLPLVFGSSAIAPIAQMPHWLQVFARCNPVTPAVDLSRNLVNGGPLLHDFLLYVAWTGGIAVVFTILAVRSFQRSS
ncbi:ABC transporter permease [Dactylosporangium sp. NPDC005572]|uniref:ABC transporter permease n=1 Tax=Dactylosporangium sp. NPDC005572 TaxID=3156889 RepID=UPI0033A06870